MQALDSAIRTKMPGQPGFADERGGFVDERFGDRCEHDHAASQTIPAAPGLAGAIGVPLGTFSRSCAIWIDLTNSPHVLVMRPVIERLRGEGHEVTVTARDFAQTLELCERLGIAHTAVGHHRGSRLAAKARGPRLALGRARALGARAHPRSRPVRPRAGPRLQRHHRRRGAAADTQLDDVRLRVGHASSTTSTAASRGRSWCPTRSPPSAWTAMARGASCAPTRASRRSTTSPTSSPTRRCWTSSGSTARAPIVVVRTPPEVSLYHRFANDLFADVLESPRAAPPPRRAPRSCCCRASRPSGRSSPRCPASSCPSTRSTRSR